MSNNKYYGRSSSIISRDNNSIDVGEKQPSWFGDFVSNLEKISVKSKSQDASLFDQINNIINSKSKYSSVEEAVLDMQKRTGLFAFLQSKKAFDNGSQQQMPEIFGTLPQLKIFIDNWVENRPGTAVEAVITQLLNNKEIKAGLPISDDVPEDVKRYINYKIIQSNLDNPSNSAKNNLDIGKTDLSVDNNVSEDNNPFSGCEPNKDLSK